MPVSCTSRMQDNRIERIEPGPQDACGLVALALWLWMLGTAVRLWLSAAAFDALRELSASQLFELYVRGLRLDGVVVGYAMLPATIALLLPRRIRGPALRAHAWLAVGFFSAAHLAEIGFFWYYGARPNYLVLEYGASPEVWSTIRAAYLAPQWIALAAAIAACCWICIRSSSRMLAHSRIASVRWASRDALGWTAMTLACAILARGTLDHRPLNPSAAAFTTHRIANEIAGSGLLNVVYEAARRTRNESPRVEDLFGNADDAWQRVQNLLRLRGRLTRDSSNPLVREIDGKGLPGIRNVVLVVMESFTGRLVGALGGEPALSPELDALAKQGVLLTHCYATGERTVQGLEAVLSSFPSLPGVAALRRPEAQTGFTTLADLLEQRGYDTLFLYGGQGIFDHMRSFALGNGFRTFIEEDDFKSPRFRGSWGVSDEDVFARANQEFQARHDQGRPFFGTILTISLHSPWEFPRGKAAPLPERTPVPDGFERAELENFLYADYAIGAFMRDARSLPYARETLFVFVADHGVHLRGSSLIPAEEYRVPALFLAPGLEPRRIEQVTSQIDIPPTVLGLLGGVFRSPFFGRDVLDPTSGEGFAVLVYQKKRYGMRRADRLTVLGEVGAEAAYRLHDGTLRAARMSGVHENDARDTLSVLLVAESLLESRRFTTARR
jgi:phosphoglycerol transferase MdoB-like AlkP superfamily enzyme